MNRELTLLLALLAAGAPFAVLPWVRRESARVRRTFFSLLLLVRLIYLYWRITETLPPPALRVDAIYAYVFLGLELLINFSSFRFLSGILKTCDRRDQADRAAGWYAAAPPLIDIFIPTYNESAAVVEKTLVGATRQTYPRYRVWVLDDGRRPFMADLARQHGAGYLVRDDNLHAKAGNMNAGLKQVMALDEPPDFIAVLDADFIPRPRFLERTMALMQDPAVGLVQTPQHHYNFDAIQSSFRAYKGWPDVQRYTFEVVHPASDAHGYGFCCGTSFLVRRSGLDAIGGFPTEAVTEDVLTSVKLRMKGLQSVYLQELLSTGLAPEGLHEYLTQRGRWCLGGIQIGLWLGDLARRSGRSWLQRLLDMEPMLRWGYTSFIRLLFMLVPLIFWFGGVPPFVVEDPWMAAVYTVPMMVLYQIFSVWISRGTQLPLVFEASWLLSGFVVVRATLKGLFQRRNHRFVVTDKGVTSTSFVFHWHTLRWFVLYELALLLGLIHGISDRGRDLDAPTVVLTAVWSVMNLVVVGVAMIPCMEPPRPRTEERYATQEALLVEHEGRVFEASARDISVSGVAVIAGGLAVGDAVRLHVRSVGWLDGHVVRRARGRDCFGVKLQPSDDERRALIAKLFCSDDYIKPVEQGSVLAAGKAIASALLW